MTIAPTITELPAIHRAAEAARNMIELRGVTKSYYRGKQRVDVLSQLDLDIRDGAFEALMGPSGSGKTTLLNLVAGLDRPTSGSIKVAGAETAALGDSARARWRARNIGFVFQTYNMLPALTAIENVELSLLLVGKLSRKQRRARAETALQIVGLPDRAHHYPSQLSGGQEQRVAIARAIVTDPRIIVADEPTGDLDRQSANEILDLLQQLNRDEHKTILMVTHDPEAAERASRVHRLDKRVLVD
jgi:putative ABC transport system ATP-binding protein